MRAPRARALVLAACAALATTDACAPAPLAPEGQLVVHVDTDAPLVTSANERLDADTRAGLFDTLLADVLDGSGALACESCRRRFNVTQNDRDADALTFGVRLPPGATGYRLRLRLFPHEARVGDGPREDAAIDGLYELPAHAAEGRVDVSAVLRFDAVGVAADLSSAGEPITLGRAPRVAPLVPTARPVCSDVPRPGEVCVPGGVYWASHAYLTLDAGEEWRAVVVQPFFLDAAEVTVGDLRASGLATTTDPQRKPGCTYRDTPGDTDVLPATCVSVALARAYCRARSADLPTLAQFEYVRGRLAHQTYVWGSDPPTCADAVWGRVPSDGSAAPCASLGAGPQPAASGERDRLVLAGGTITDLAANVGELLADRPAKSCRGRGVYFDPVCGPPGGITLGSFAETLPETLTASARRFGAEAPLPDVGFRCARPGE